MWKWIKKHIFRIKPVVIDIPLEKPKFEQKDTSIDSLPKGAFGVDISHHNKSVDLDVLCENVDFIYMKATEGTSFLSKTYHSRAKQLKEKKIPWGAYHYYKVNSDPIEQAIHFIDNLYLESGLPPVLDIEGINNNFKSPRHTEDLLLFLERVELITGIVPIVYTGYYFAKDKIKPTKAFSKYPLWIAWYTSDFKRVKTPRPWSQIKMWQYSETGTVKGVNGDVDVNKVMS